MIKTLQAAVLTLLLLTGEWASSVPVYREPEARFATGDLPASHLRPDNQIILRPWIQIPFLGHTADSSENISGWIPRSSALNVIDLSQTAFVPKDSFVRAYPDASLHSQSLVSAGTKVKCIDKRGNWVKIATDTVHGWLTEDMLVADIHDPGILLTRKPAALRQSSDAKSKIIKNLAPALRLTPVSLKGNLVQVRVGGLTGWIPFSETISKFDLASKALIKSLSVQWQDVLNYRMGKIKVGKHWVHFSRVDALETDPNKIVIMNHQVPVHSLPTVSHSKILGAKHFGDHLNALSFNTISWFHSYKAEVGSFWWPSFPAGVLESEKARSTFSSEYVFSRKAFDIASDPLNSNFKVVSAGGIFLSKDGGHQWEKVSFFKTHNYPVAISPRGEIYVGFHKSIDGGRTFKPYMRWDRLLEKIWAHEKAVPSKLRITRIEFRGSDSQLHITVNNGVTLSSPDGGSHWNYVSHQTPKQSDLERNLASYDGW